MSHNFVIIGKGDDKKHVTLGDLDDFTLMDLRAFRSQLGVLAAALDDNVADGKRRVEEDPSDKAAKDRLHRARYKKGQVLYFIGEAKAREALMGAGKAGTCKKLSGKQMTHLAHQRADKKYEFFKRRNLHVMLKQIVGEDMYDSLEQKAKATASDELKEWAKAEHIDDSMITHVLASKL